MSEKEKQNSLFFKQRYVTDWGISLFNLIKKVGKFPLLKTYSFSDIISSKTIKKNYLLIITGGFLFGLFLLMIFAVWKIPQIQVPNKLSTAERERITLEDKVRTTLIQAIGGSAIFITGCFALLNYQISQKKLELDKETSQKNLELADSKQITERFSKAVEQLGEESITVRLGAIYSLERIAKDSKYDHWTIMEVLTAFIREKSNDDRKPDSKIPQDIQAALTVIGRRNTKSDIQNEMLYLDNIDFSGAELRNANFSNIYFAKTKFNYANLYQVKFNNALLYSAEFKYAHLHKADFTDANLTNADLSNANFTDANLTNADIENTKIFNSESYFLRLGKYLKIELQITVEQILKAKNWDKAHYNPEFWEKMKPYLTQENS
ncbi:MAG: pentapeptide repeat-containing protein [Snowella sp.]|nr:pentapeptide repeat-containing protein [Snowella sp.]